MTKPAVEDVLGKIAVIGMSGRYPKAANLEQYWKNLAEGRECISFFSDEELLEAGAPPELVHNPDYVKALGAYEGTFLFDAPFFGYTPREAELLDPQHRVLMECAWESLEYAGYDPSRYPGRIGMFAGSGATQYLFELLSFSELWNVANRFALLTYNDRDFLATQIGYKLDLRGPCITVQTACSTSLVAIVLACQSLLTYQSDIALAGGVTLDAQERGGHLYQQGGVASIDGHCRAFDASATGIVGGCGAGVVALKRLQDAREDGDTVHAVILGFGLNNDGASRVGFTAPGVEGQVGAYSDAIAMAGINPETIAFVECHGTGTPIGDPIELTALTRAFRSHTSKRNFCAFGSVKTNIGHTGAAAGVAGFTKAVLSLEHKTIPPSLHFRTPNPQLELEQSPFYVNTEAKSWPQGAVRRRAATTSLGAGGTNAHVILEEAPEQISFPSVRTHHLLVLSAKSSSTLNALNANLAQHLTLHPPESMADLEYTLQVGRKVFPYRRFVVCRGKNSVEALNSGMNTPPSFREKPAGPLVYLFPGQGSQRVNMARDLYAIDPMFREQMQLCAEVLKPELGLNLLELLYPDSHGQETAAERLAQTQYTQPALFTIEYALAKTWMKWGLHPECMIGHSVGEYTAACLAGVFSLETALRLVASRGRLMQQAPDGSMTGIMLPASVVASMLVQHPEVSLAAFNAPSACVISGPTAAVAKMEERLAEDQVSYARLHVTSPFHSAMMESIIPAFRKELEKIKMAPPKLRYMSSLTGKWITADEATNPEYWTRHLRQPVNFCDAVLTLLQTPRRIFLEVGPGHTLTSLVAQYPQRTLAHPTICSLPHPRNGTLDNFAFLLNAMGQLWLEGCEFNWRAVHCGEARRRIPLPTYPFEKHYYRITTRKKPLSAAGDQLQENEASRNEEQKSAQVFACHERPILSTPYVAPRNELERAIARVWASTLGIHGVGADDNFVELGGHSLLAIQLSNRISEIFAVPFTVEQLYQAPTIAGVAGCAARLFAENSETAAAEAETGKMFALGNGRPSAHSPAIRDNYGAETSTIQPRMYPGLEAPLVPIRAVGKRQALFLVHPGGGGTKVYQELAKYLDQEQPVYAFQCHVLGSQKAHPLVPVEEMAAHYNRFLLQVQRAGPYLLGGWSTGGVVAFEMAVQLQNCGHAVSLVGIFDAASRHHPENGSISPRLRMAEDILATGVALAAREGQTFGLSRSDLEHLSENEQLEMFVRELQSKKIVPPEVDRRALQALLTTFANTHKALEYYIPGTYHGRVLVLRATDITPELRELTKDIYDDPSFGWQQYCTRPVDVRYVPGDHMHIAVEPNIRTLAAVFQRCIDELGINGSETLQSSSVP